MPPTYGPPPTISNNAQSVPTSNAVAPTQQLPPQSPQQLDDNKVRQMVIDRFEAGRQAAIPQITNAAKFYKLFRNKQTVRNYTGLAQLFVPEPWRIVRKKTAKLGNAINRVRVTPQTPNDEEPANIATTLLNFLRRKLNWGIVERIAIQEARIVGMAWLKVTWNDRKAALAPDRPYMGFDITFDTIDHVIIPPDLTSQDILAGNIPWLIHYYKASLADVRANPNYNQQKVQQLETRTGQSASRRSQATVLEQARTMFTQAQRAYTIRQDKKFDVYEYYGYMPVEEMQQDGTKITKQFDSLVVVADKDIVLRNTPNPYAQILDERIPFVPVVANIVGQETWPVGDIEPSESLFNELNDTRNQRMDTVTLNIDPMKLVMRGANIDERELIARKGWIVHTNMANGVTVIPPDMSGVKAAIEEETIIRGDIQQTSGVIDFGQDTNVQAGVEIDTARGAMIAKSESDIGAEEELDLLKISLIKLYRIILAYSQTFLDKEFTVRLLQKGTQSFQTISSDRVRGNLDLDIEMQTLQDKTTQQQLKLLLLNQARETPGANIGKFFTDALEALTDGEVNIQEYYQAPQPQPEQPKVSISLKGDLTQLQSASIYQSIPGVDKDYGDPMLVPEGRDLIKGIHPEELDTMKKQQDIISQQKADEQSANDTQESGNAAQ